MSDRGRSGQDRMPGGVWVLATVGFLVAVGYGVVYPVLPVYARTFGVSNLLVGLVVATFAAMRLAAAPAAGRLVVRLPERTMLTAGVWIVAGSSALAGLAGSYAELLVWRALGGIGSIMFSVSASGLLLALAPPSRRGRASGLFQGGFLLGGMTGPAVGGALTGISLTAPFFFYAAMLAVTGIVSLVALPGGNVARGAAPDQAPLGFVAALRDGRFRAAVTAAFAAGWQSLGVGSLLVPLVVVEVLRREPRWTGVAFAAAAAAQAATLPGAGWATDRVGRRPLLVAGTAVMATVSAGYPYAGSYVVLVALMCCYAVGTSLASTAQQATVADALGRRGGPALAGLQMVTDLGAILGPLAAGLLTDHVSMPAAFAVGAVLLGIASVTAARMPAGRPDR